MLDQHAGEMDDVIHKRCAYVIKENIRVLNACQDLEKKDFRAFGKRMFQSHDGLSKEYEVSCSELDVLVDIASGIKGVLGSRMMGGGFGGCTINLVETDAVEEFQDVIEKKYRHKTGRMTKFYVTSIESGVEIVG
jgi:galactokinase